MKFKAKVYKLSKGTRNQGAYMAMLKNNTCDILRIERDSALMLKVNGKEFVTVARRNSEQNKVMTLGFTVPFKISRDLETKQDIIFDLLGFSTERIYNEKLGFINLQKAVPNRTVRGCPMYMFSLGRNKLLFWIYSKGNKTCTLPVYVPLEKTKYNLLELFGAFLCEGFKSRKKGRHRDRLSFSSIERDTIGWFLNSLEVLLSINKKQWKCQILHPKNGEPDVNEIRDFWSKTGISEKSISVIKNYKVSAKYGVCILNLYNSTLSEVFQHLMDYCKKMSLCSEENAIQVFKGFSRGDIGISKDSISFSAAEEGDAIFFKNICRKMGLKTSRIYKIVGKKGYWQVFITGRHNFEKILRNEAITHTARKVKLINNLLGNKKFPIYKYLKSIGEGYNTSKSASEFLNLSQISTRMFLSRYEKEGYLKSVIDNSYYHQKIYSFTRKGGKTYRFLKNLEMQAGG